MAISKVTFNGVTQMDVTDDNPAAGTMFTGVQATGANGQKVQGSYTPPTKTSDLTNDGDDGTHPFLDEHQDISGKADKVTGGTSGNLVKLDSSGNLADSGVAASSVITSHQNISGKADKVSGATSNNFAALDSNGNLKDSGHKHSDYLTSHQDISGKADKVSSATNNNFAALDSNGNLKDSGHKHSDYLTSHQSLDGKQDKITVSGILKGNGSGGVSAAVAGTDYQTPLTAGTDYAPPLPSGGTAGQVLTKTSNGEAWADPAGGSDKQDKITASGILKGNGSGTVSAAVAGTDYVSPAGLADAINRSTTVDAADTNYSTVMARGIYAGTEDMTAGTTALTSGVIYLVYE